MTRPYNRTAPPLDESSLYTEDAVFIGLLLYPPRVCLHCHMTLPANRDYFVPDKQHGEHGDGVTYNCRRCRRQAQRESYRRRRAAS